MRCKYAKICKHFSDASYTCMHDEEAEGYCGIAKREKETI